MWRSDKEHFRKLVDECGSPYAAVNHIAMEARRKLKEVDSQILDSKAITWALTGIPPKIHNRNEAYYLRDEAQAYLDDMLCYVDDEDVCESVRNSYKTSKRANHLIYVYKNDLDESRRARVRILTRIVWEYSRQARRT